MLIGLLYCEYQTTVAAAGAGISFRYCTELLARRRAKERPQGGTPSTNGNNFLH